MELPMKVAVISGSVFVFIIIFGWVAFPAIMKFGIKHQMTLEPGNELRDMWSNLPFAIDFKIYMFNVTNAKDVENNGDSPMLDEIGPFVFEEWKSKVNLQDNETDDTVAFNAKTRWYFNQERSGKLTGEEEITIPHPVIMSMLLRTASEKPPMLPMAYKAVNGIFDNPTSMFITVRVKDILFDGVPINCNRSDFIPHAACFEMKQEESLKKLPNDTLLFSFFGHIMSVVMKHTHEFGSPVTNSETIYVLKTNDLSFFLLIIAQYTRCSFYFVHYCYLENYKSYEKNNSVEERMKVKRGSQNPLDLNKVVEFKNKTVMRVWPTKECNLIKGTEASVYHTLIEDNETLYGFVPLLCRELPIIFVRNEEFKGFDTALYTTSFGDQTNNEKEKCYCPTRKFCMKKGTMELSRCSGAPIIASFPHFYDADESYLESVRGLRPDEKLHQSRFHFEPFTGIILGAVNRLQFSFHVKTLENISIMKNAPEAMVPLLWLEEAVVLNSTYLNNLNKQVFLLFRINNVIKWTVLILSATGMVTSIYLAMRKKRGFSLGVTMPRLENDDIRDTTKSSTIINSLSGMIGKEAHNQ